MVMALGFAAIPAEAAPPAPKVDYVALGDSYTAGTGADTVGSTALGPFVPTLPCTQTAQGYADIVDRTDPIVLVDNEACHGALLTVPTWDGVPSAQSQIETLIGSGSLSKNTELVSITAGANDVGVSTVLFECITSTEARCTEVLLEARAAMPGVTAKLAGYFEAIKRQAPRARIVVLGYPRLFNPAGFPVLPEEKQELINQGTALLNEAISSAADRAHVQYVDVAARFVGHEVNTTAPWVFLSTSYVNGVPQVDLFDPRNFHPNQAGHAQYAEALLASVNLKQLARP
jgi:lysophospholipase L1-like esterase